MKHIGEIRVSGAIIINGNPVSYSADPRDLVELCREVRSEEVWRSPVPVMDDEGNAVGSLFPCSQFPEVKRLVLFIGQNEYQIRAEDFVLVMQESQFAAQIFDIRPVEAIEGQATLGAYA